MNRSPDKQHEAAPVQKPQPAAPQERRKASNLMEWLTNFDLDPPDNLERALPDGESDDEAGNTKDGEQPQDELTEDISPARDAKAKQEGQSDPAEDPATAAIHAMLAAPYPDEPDEPKPVETQPDDAQKPLEEAKDLLARARQVSDALFKEARNMQEYRRMLATSERNAQFESKLLAKAKKIDSRLGTHLPANALREAVARMAKRIAAWEHSPERQRERQKKQAAARRHENLGRDMQVVRGTENGESRRAVAKRFEISRGAVENVLRRDAPHLLNRRKKHNRPSG